MKIYRRYLAREVSGGIVLVLSAFLGLFGFFDMIAEVKNVGQGTYELHHALAFVLLRMPGRAYELMPIAVLIGTLYALSTLAGAEIDADAAERNLTVEAAAILTLAGRQNEKLIAANQLNLFAYYNHWWTPRLSSALGGGYVDMLDTKVITNDNTIKSTSYASTNLIYYPNDHFKFGLEVLYGKRKDMNDKTRDTFRFQFTMFAKI